MWRSTTKAGLAPGGASETTLASDRALALPVQFLSFAGMGVIATLVQYAVLVVFVDTIGMNATLASGIGYGTGALVNYALNYRYTFRSKRNHSEAVVKFALVACVGLALNSVIMFVLSSEAHVHYLLAQILATGIVLVWNFIANRSWTFVR
jgi:putative flippase GtrA